MDPAVRLMSVENAVEGEMTLNQSDFKSFCTKPTVETISRTLNTPYFFCVPAKRQARTNAFSMSSLGMPTRKSNHCLKRATTLTVKFKIEQHYFSILASNNADSSPLLVNGGRVLSIGHFCWYTGLEYYWVLYVEVIPKSNPSEWLLSVQHIEEGQRAHL